MNLFFRLVFVLAVLAVFAVGNLTFFLAQSEFNVKMVTFGPTRNPEPIWACYKTGVSQLFCADIDLVIKRLRTDDAQGETL